MRYLSLFSGIEAASCAWEPMGWTPVAFAEIEPFPCSLLAQRWPGVPNLGDVRGITRESLEALGPIDVVIGGSPCQDLSVSGGRAGLSGSRSSLFHEQVRIFHAARTLCGARWLLWENVPGAFSVNAGRDFAIVVSALAGTNVGVPVDGWGNEGLALGPNGLVEWSVLDAQWFGVAQRRRRVFAVLDTGNWRDRRPVLLERESLRGDSAPRREAREAVAPSLAARTGVGGGLGTDFDFDGGLTASEDGTGRGTPLVPEVCPALKARDSKGAPTSGHGDGACLVPIAFHNNLGEYGTLENLAPPLKATMQHDPPCVTLPPARVRRLTPTECERLQGFPEARKAFTMSVSFDGGADECSGNQKSFVSAETKNLRSQSNALHADESEFQSAARVAGLGLNAGQASSSEPVLVSALIDLERQRLQLRSAGRLLLSVNTAEQSEWCRLPISRADFAQLIARMHTFADPTILHGVEGSPQSTTCSTHRRNGSVFAQLCGHAISELVSDAEMFTNALRECLKSTISVAGQNSQNCDLTRETLFSCVAAVICSFIPEQIQSGNSFALNIETVQGYTLIPWRNKPADECPDGPRYRALGNSMAVPVIAWIGRRIERAHTWGAEA